MNKFHSRGILAACFFVVSTGAHAGLQEGLNAYRNGNYAVALKELAPLAGHGDAEAQHCLGMMYEFGQGVPKDIKQAAEWYNKSREQVGLDKVNLENAAPDQQAIDEADWLRMFCGPGKDCTAVLLPDAEQVKAEQIRLEARSAEQARVAEAKRRIVQEVQAEEQARSEAEAQARSRAFAIAEAKARVAQQARFEAEDKAAAEARASAAERVELALRLDMQLGQSDRGGDKAPDIQVLADLYRKSAWLGNAEAQRNIGKMYAEGRGVPLDLVQAHAWLNLAAAAGNGGAQNDMQLLENKMSLEQIEQARQRVQKWLEQHK